MPRQRGQIIEQEKGKKYLVRFNAGNVGGKRVSPSQTVYGTRRDAAKVLTAMLAKHDAGKLSIKPESRLNVKQISEMYIDARAKEVAKGKLSAAYMTNLKRCLRAYFSPHFGTTPISGITSRDLQRFVNRMSETYAPGSVQTIFQQLRGLLKWCFTNGYINEMPVSPKMPNIPRTAKRVYTWEELQLLLKATHPRFRPVFLTLACTGLRPSEVCRLEWDDIDLAGRTLYVKRSKTEAGKRAVLLPHVLVEDLLRLERVGKTIFHDGYGNALVSKDLYRPFKRAAKLAGLPGYPYMLRHTHTTRNLEVPGLSDKIISERQGHASETFTRGTYMHPEVGMQAPITDLWDRKLRASERTN